MEKIDNVWYNILDTLRDNISEQGFNTWFSETSPLNIDDNQMNIKVPTQFIADYLNKNYSEMISEIFYNLYNTKQKVKFTSKKKETSFRNEEQLVIPTKDNLNAQSKLNPNYNFDEFVIGTNNKFAHSASLAVAESPGNTYNPLFLYGESGMGKTHLMQAVGNFVNTDHFGKKVFYISTEEFTNSMIDSIRT